MSSHRPATYDAATTQPSTGSGNIMRLLGILLSLGCVVLVVLNFFFFSSTRAPLVNVLTVLIGIFGVRILFLWLGINRGIVTMPIQERTDKQLPLQYMQTPFVEQQRVIGQVPTTMSEQEIQPLPQTPSPPRPLYPHRSSQGRIPAYVPASAYSTQTPSLAENVRDAVELPTPYIPIEQDALFQLDVPVGEEHYFLLPKEGEPLVECQDRFALNADSTCYAIADGVAGSFVPGPWARIVAQNFVARKGTFANQNEFQQWLIACGEQWHTWIEQRWVPTMNALREQHGDKHGDWSNDIRQGAQTTLLGCTLYPNADLTTDVHLFAIGDCEFFLLSLHKGEWMVKGVFPFSECEAFSARPHTLVTIPRQDLLERAWVQHKHIHVKAMTGDCIVLASDTLAKWLLTQMQSDNKMWLSLVNDTNANNFEHMIRQELYANSIEDDDLTLLVIPIV